MLKKFLFTLIIIGLTSTLRVLAVNSVQESILSKVDKAIELQGTNVDSALSLAYEVLKESREIDYTAGVGYAYVRIGSIFNIKGESDSALFYLTKAYQIRVVLGNKSGAADIMRLVGFIYKNNGKVDSAFSVLYRSVRLVEELDDSILLVRSYLELAHNLVDYNQPRAAKEYYDKSFLIAERINDSASLANCYDGFGKYYFHGSNYQKALTNYLKVAELLDDLLSETDFSNTYNNIAVCYDKLGKFKLAIGFYKNALKSYSELGSKRKMAITNYNLGITFTNSNNLDSAIIFYKKSIVLGKQVGDIKQLSDSYKELSIAYASLNNYKLAFESQQKHFAFSDSLLNIEKISSIAEMQTKYETEKKEQEITMLNQENKTKEAQRNLLFAVAVSLLLGVVTLSFLYLQRKKIAKKNEFIAGQKIESLLDEQEIKTYNAMLEGQEEERMRIATDLHDRLGSMLSTVKLLFSALDSKIDQNQKESKKQYEKANYLLDEACVEVRRVSHNLGTGMVANFGLYRALEELCESIDDSGKIKCTMQAFGIESGSLKLKVEVGVYRMVQEVFNNTLKYAKAKNLTLQLNRNEDDLSIMIEDDGIGFDLQEAKLKGGMGLNNLEMRVTKLKGTLHIDTKVGRGVTTIIEIPLNSIV